MSTSKKTTGDKGKYYKHVDTADGLPKKIKPIEKKTTKKK